MSASVFRFATVSGRDIDWHLKRNCSFRPSQLAVCYASLCVVSLAIAIGFWSQGARFIVPFAGLELVCVGIAFLIYARHAADNEHISLRGARLVVEVEEAGRCERAEFPRDWVRVEPRRGDRSLIEVSAQGRSVTIGRHVRPELRGALASEIRRALRGSAVPLAHGAA